MLNAYSHGIRIVQLPDGSYELLSTIIAKSIMGETVDYETISYKVLDKDKLIDLCEKRPNTHVLRLGEHRVKTMRYLKHFVNSEYTYKVSIDGDTITVEFEDPYAHDLRYYKFNIEPTGGAFLSTTQP